MEKSLAGEPARGIVNAAHVATKNPSFDGIRWTSCSSVAALVLEEAPKPWVARYGPYPGACITKLIVELD